jgi:hypothetical protein
MNGFVSVTHQVSICCGTNSGSELGIQNVSCASKRVPVTIATVYITWVSFFTISLVLFTFSSLLQYLLLRVIQNFCLLSLIFLLFFLIPFSLFPIYSVPTV